MQKYIMYDTGKGLWYCKEELFEDLKLDVVKKVRCMLSEQEAEQLTYEKDWNRVKTKIQDILNSKD